MTLKNWNLTSMIVVPQDDAALARLRKKIQTITPESARLLVELAQLKLDETQATTRELASLGDEQLAATPVLQRRANCRRPHDETSNTRNIAVPGPRRKTSARRSGSCSGITGKARYGISPIRPHRHIRSRSRPFPITGGWSIAWGKPRDNPARICSPRETSKTLKDS
ncbi:MAG: hypothetical protein U0903_00690 [Planctomycetales bacterium]